MWRVWTTVLILAGFVALGAQLGPWVHTQQAGLRPQSASCPTAGVAVPTNTEASLITSPGVTTLGGQTVTVHGEAVITAPAGTTGLQLGIRRGSGTAGVYVVTPTIVSATGSAAAAYTYEADDSPPEVAGLQYSLTVKSVTGTANGTANTCGMFVMPH